MSVHEHCLCSMVSIEIERKSLHTLKAIYYFQAHVVCFHEEGKILTRYLTGFGPGHGLVMFHTWFCFKLNKPEFWICIVDQCDWPGQPMNGPTHIPCKSEISLNMCNSSRDGRIYTFWWGQRADRLATGWGWLESAMSDNWASTYVETWWNEAEA